MMSETRSGQDTGSRITAAGIVLNLGLLALKLAVGLLVGSAALFADGIHSASDIATDLAVLGGMRIARRKPDVAHPYGHGRFETLAGATVSGALILVGAYLVWTSGSGLYRGIESFPGAAVVFIAALSVGIKEWLYRRTSSVATRVGSAALLANAWHHRSDALSSVAVLAGGIGGLVGWGHADQLAGLIVGLMVVVAGGRTLGTTVHELTEGGVARSDLETAAEAIAQVEGVRDWHQLRGRRVGRESFMDVHVLVDPQLSVVAAHRIATEVEDAVRIAFPRPINLVVHVEPVPDDGIEHAAER